ncbi:choline/carnitine O-acyltransferase [Secundilactobacillus hailunensis]|uniref:Choline/carnitine O-acyltransferase n=1 Tax=Secundilactobacillus hailunensis TaxID=2559923 RepID=A0ABW1T9A0_9LACO|nr:choline/carnitine O-acyltransferase [Secundilactobacillus hailunensis]
MTAKYSTQLLPQLAKLPLPDIDVTLSRLEEWSRPLLGELQRTKFADQIAAFKANDAPELQALLKQRWAETNANWFAPISRQHALKSRHPLQASSNFAFTVSSADLLDLDQVTMAAKLLQNFADQYLAYASEEAPVEATPDGQPVDMSTYQQLFRTQRQPELGQDILQKTRNTSKNVEVTVIYHQTVYQVRLIDHAGRVSTLHSLTEALAQIMENTATDAFFIGAYTGLPRDDAARLQQHLATNQGNYENLQRISTSLLVLTLQDSNQPLTAQSTLLGPQDRIFDKTVQVIVSADGHVGFAFERSQTDPYPTLKLITAVVNQLSQPADQWDSKGKPHFQQLTWQLDHYTKEALSEAANKNALIANELVCASTTIQDLGNEPLKELNIDSDAFSQIGLALAEYRATGGWRNISEPVSMRHFYQGRTASMASITLEEQRFITAFAAGQRDAATKQLFDQAMAAHNDRVILTDDGFGIAHHLLGLQTTMTQTGGNEAFPDAAVFFHSAFLQHLATDFFSTINLPFEVIDSLATVPTSADGYGIYYGVLKTKLSLTVSAWKTNSFTAEELLTNTIDSLTELADWLTAQYKG